MSLISRLLLSLAALTATAAAQCLDTSGGMVVPLNPTTTWTPDDEGLSAPIPMGFAFPMPGASAPSFTHVSVDSNGAIYLSNGAPPIGATMFGYADWLGIAGDSPRLAPFWTDLEGVAPTWSVKVDSSVPGVCAVNWVDVNEYGFAGTKSFQARLFAAGDVEFTYANGLAVVAFSAAAGLSVGNGISDPEGPSDFSQPLSTSSDGVMYMDLTLGAVPMQGTTLHFAPDGLGGYTATTTCALPAAGHTGFGRGCYQHSTSFYELFSPATGFDLSGSALTMLPTGSGYTVVSGLGAFLPPSGAATDLALVDDAEATATLAAPFAFPGGTTTALQVCSNGFVSVGSNGVAYLPDVSQLLDAPHTGWWSWHDFDPTQGGQVLFEQVGGIACVTWNGVYSRGTTTPETMQFQFDLNAGSVSIFWVSISGQGNDLLVGYSPGGLSQDPGATDLSASLPASFQVVAIDHPGVTLTADPAPISTATTGTVVTYTTDFMSELAPGVYVGLNVLSLSSIPAPGLDLTVLGAPGCAAFVGSIDLAQAMVGPTPSQSVTLAIPPGIGIGTLIFSQSVVLVPPFSQPNGQNAAGLLTSNGLQTLISAF
ncbi:MAG: hypothetical protein K8J09_13595 [Planctomycetes bacterium]|nr:hypothetical protein [Planctomycetota bacterium]MCC7399121.1 hypothetical protein [Planctomycetota bacterium]